MIVSGNVDSSLPSIVQVSTNYGANWSTVRIYYNYFAFYSCAMDASASNFLIGAGGGGTSFIEKSTNLGVSWTSVFTNTNGSAINDININASNGWAIASQYGTAFAGSYLIRTSTSGSIWTQISGGSAQQSWVRSIINNTVEGKALYYLGTTGTSYIQSVTSSGPVFLGTVGNLTTSGSRTWHSLANSDNGTYILAGENSGLYLSTNGGASFNAL